MPATTTPEPSFQTTYCSIDRAKASPTQAGFILPLIDGPTRTLRRFESHVSRVHAKCAAHEAHRHPDEEVVIAKSGLIEVEVEGVVHTLSAGDMIVIASNDLHGIRNTSTQVAEYYILRMEV